MIGHLALDSTVLEQCEIDVRSPAFFTGREPF
jgi:hypothetical protein